MANNNCITNIWDPERENYSWKYSYVIPKDWGRGFRKINDYTKIIEAQKNYKNVDVICDDPNYPIKDNDYIDGVYDNEGNKINPESISDDDDKNFRKFYRVAIKCRKKYDDISKREKLLCCSGKKDNKECSPELCPSNDYCNDIMKNYCSKNDNITNLPICKKLKKNNKKLYNEILNSYCTEYGNEKNILKDECKKYCKNNPIKCYDSLEILCNNKQNCDIYDDICGCFYNPNLYNQFNQELNKHFDVQDESSELNRCSYPKCANAYIKPTDCYSEIADCLNDETYYINGNIEGEINLKENCESIITKKENPSKNNNHIIKTILYIIGIIALILCIGSIIKNKKN
jgi:hypothetical protein